MNEILNFNSETMTISARELHEKLNIATAFKDWFPRMCEYGFVEGEDFNMLKNERVQIEGNREVKRIVSDADISIDMAKQICMIQRTPEGKAVRQYLIDLEKAWNTPELVMARGLQASQRLLEQKEQVIKELVAKNDEMKPKALFADAVSTSETSILVGDLAKLIRQNGVDIGRGRLFDWLRNKGYLIKGGTSQNMPTQRSMDLGLMEVKERTFQNPDGSVRITRTTTITGKGQVYFVNKFLGNSDKE